MSKTPFVVTLVVSGAFAGWVYETQENIQKEAAVRARVRALVRIYGFPDERGVVLELREPPTANCPGAQFRSESPDVVVWDDGTILYRTSTFDYRKGRLSPDQLRHWQRTFRSFSKTDTVVSCEAARMGSAPAAPLRIAGRVAGHQRTLSVAGLGTGSHTESCADCRPVRPLARMIEEISRRKDGEAEDPLLSGMTVEVRLEWRSCGCRNHPDIVQASKEWPLTGPRPEEICGRGSARFRLHDPAQVRALAEAIERSAAVLDGGEIYTCFMRPVLDLDGLSKGLLARR